MGIVNVGDKLLCKKSINIGMKYQGVFYYHKHYEVMYVDGEYIHMKAENGGNYLFFQDDYASISDVDRMISTHFYTGKEVRKIKLDEIKRKGYNR